MAAAYAALVSLMQVMNQIEHHPRPPVYLDKEQVDSLTENVSFLQEFLEANPSNEEHHRFESRIAGAAYMVEDIVESFIVDQIQDGNYGENTVPIEFHRGLQRAIEDLDLLKKEAVEIKANQPQMMMQQRNSSMVSSSSIVKSTTMVGFDDVLLQVLDKLTDGQPERHIIPIVGMGGIGKTTLAKNAYAHPYIKEHFDIFAWVTISQHDTRKILSETLREANLGSGDLSEKDENEIGEVLHKCLFGRRYLIIMDDVWSIEAWDKIKFFLPDCSNGSRIVVTTRLSNLACQLTNSCVIDMKFLSNDESWDLFSKIVFPQEGCPPELEGIGKRIVWSCRGLPLSIVVIGGVLAKSGFEREYWEHVERNLNTILNSENEEQCLKILEMSYNELPVHLKPCFLYVGIIKEDHVFPVSGLVRVWVAEGFVKPDGDKNLEEVGEEYVKDLVDRNLVLVHKLRYMTKRIKKIKIHDLLRDLCRRQAEKERFYNLVRQHSVGIPQDTLSQRRLIICDARLEDSVQHALLSMPLTRTLQGYFEDLVPSPNHRLLRIFDANDASLLFYDYCFLKNQLVNLRHIYVGSIPRNPKSASPLHLLWNLQILYIKGKYNGECFTAPVEFWKMPYLSHVKVHPFLHLSYPIPASCNGQDEIVLENLQTLTDVLNFKFGKGVLKRIPNLKKLAVSFDLDLISNLDQLHKLESLVCICLVPVNQLSFPRSLKKLVLHFDCCDYYWEDILEKIGSLPLLQKLILEKGSFREQTWETVEGQFPSLKVLKLRDCDDLKCWMSESSHFPRLEHLVLDRLDGLDEIPSGIGEIETLQSMVLKFCSESVVVSAKRIQEEQEELYGEVGLRVRVKLLHKQYEAQKDLASSNFKILAGLMRHSEKENFYQGRKRMFFRRNEYSL